jgi:DNA-binding CsgD family transcriptional regulator
MLARCARVAAEGDAEAGTGDMLDAGRALRLVERIYESVVEPDSWNAFAEDLSQDLGGAGVQLVMFLAGSPAMSADAFYLARLDPRYRAAFVKHAIEGLPWGSLTQEAFRGRFALADASLPGIELVETPFYREFMRPQGLAPEWPICHLIARDEHRPLAGLAIYRREGCRPFEPADFVQLDSLVPHLARAYSLGCRMNAVGRERRAVTEVIDRLPMGVILVDAEGRPVLMNPSAQLILARGDGFRLERGRPRAVDERENRTLHQLVEAAVSPHPDRSSAAGQVMLVTRASGKRSFPVMVGPLLAAAPGQDTNAAVAVLFIGDPEGGQVDGSDVLGSLYQLTAAEADLLRRLAEGRTLEQVAEERGVTIHTVRSQLKQVFAKTDTNRQSELVHLVLTGVAAIREGKSD